MKVLVNHEYGGFHLSHWAFLRYLDLEGYVWCQEYVRHDIDREDKSMIAIVEELGRDASSTCCNVEVQWVADKYKDYYRIYEYDGYERIHIHYSRFKLDRIKTIIEQDLDICVIKALIHQVIDEKLCY